MFEKVLSKEVCQKCYKNKGWVWTGENENEWNHKKQVRCLAYADEYGAEPIFVYINLEHNLEKCNYKFEHKVLVQKEEDNMVDYTMDEMEARFLTANKDKSCYDSPVINDVPVWSLDCQKKFDYDGAIITVDSRFYPPNYNTNEGGGWGGGSVTISCGKTVVKKKYFKSKNNIDELMKEVEEYVDRMIEKIHKAVKDALYDED